MVEALTNLESTFAGSVGVAAARATTAPIVDHEPSAAQGAYAFNRVRDRRLGISLQLTRHDAEGSIAFVPWRSAHELLLEDVDDDPGEEELERSADAERADARGAAPEAEWNARYALEVARLRRTRSRRSRPRAVG